MRLLLALAILTMTGLILIGCEASPAPRAVAAPAGTPMGNSGVYVSGAVQSGGSIAAH